MLVNLNQIISKVTGRLLQTPLGAYWLQLAPREQKMLSLMTAVLLLVLIYQLIWAPIEDKKRLADQQLNSAQAQWQWLNQQLPAWQDSAYATKTQPTRMSSSVKLANNNQLMSYLTKQLTIYKLQPQLKSMQLSAKGVKVSLNSVAGVKLLKWLQQLDMGAIQIESMEIKPTDLGMVEAELVFSLA